LEVTSDKVGLKLDLDKGEAGEDIDDGAAAVPSPSFNIVSLVSICSTAGVERGVL
jgi:hypothetical protein